MSELSQPLELSDFSGGITENFLDGDPRRYQYGDNFLITNDKKLRVRPAFVPLGNGVSATFPTGQQRMTSLFSWINESLLVGQSEKSFYTYDPIGIQWNPIPGVAGNPILSGANVYAQTSYSEFQKQIIITSDGGVDAYGSLPVNVYQNSQGAWVARTAGLPRAYGLGNYTAQTLLNQCITNANALRASMISHFQDAKNSTYVNQIAFSQVTDTSAQSGSLHYNVDHIALSYFQSVTFVANEPNNSSAPPTPATAAIDQPSLYLLLAALNSAYSLHTQDAISGDAYHMIMKSIAGIAPVQGPLAQLTNASAPVYPTDATKQLANLITVAAQIDDLTQKWYWHQLAINTHDKLNQYTTIARYMTDNPTIGVVQTGMGAPIITPDYTDFINYVNNLVAIFNGHIGVNGPHTQQANAIVNVNDNTITDTNIYLPNATDLNSAYLLIFWLRAQYYVHYTDASTPVFSTFSCNATTAGSPSLPSPVFPTTGIVATKGQWIFNNRIDNGGVYARTNNSNINTATYGVETLTAQLIAVSTNWTVDRNFLNSGFVKNFQISNSKYHSYNVAGALSSCTTAQTTSVEALTSGVTSIGTTLTTWMALAAEVFNALANHAFNTSIHASNADLATTLPPVPVYQVNVAHIWTSFAMVQNFFVPTIATYSWAFVYAYTYAVGVNGIQYTVRSNPVLSGSFSAPTSLPMGSSITTPNTVLYPSAVNQVTRGVAISGLPSLANTAETNYDLANVKLEIYRTTSGGTTYLLNNLLSNGAVTSYVDTANDSVQVGSFGPQSTQQQMYTTGGFIGSDPPPKCKFTHSLSGTTYYGAIYDAGQFFPQRVRQSVQSAPEWAPATFTDDLDDDITALTSAKDNVIVGCKNSIYRLAGGFTPQGQGAITHERIADSTGFVNQKSAVRTEIGVFFAGTDGFYYTDGYQIIKISLEIDKVYQTFVQTDAQRRAIYGAYDKTTRRVWWSLRTSPNDTDNSLFYIFYLNYGVKPSGVFTTASNFPYLRFGCSVFQQGVMYAGHELGYVFMTDQNQKQDYVVDTNENPSIWGRVGIPYNYTSCAIDTGTVAKRKWFTRVHLVGGNVGNAAVQIEVIRDMNSDGKGLSTMAPINYTDNEVWGNPLCVWGDTTRIWNNTGKMDLWRRFPATSLRGDYVQIQMTPAKVAVYASSVNYPFGANVSVNPGGPIAQLLTPSGYSALKFSPDCVGYVVAFQNDGYVKEYPITAQTDTVLTYSDPSGTSVASSGMGWVIRGFKKEQRFEINSYVINYMLLGEKTQSYPGKTSDAGPGNAGENPS